MAKQHVITTINGNATEFLCETRQTMLDVLRDELNMTGTKEGCGSGDCGACSVTVDGRLVCACLMLGVEAQGKSINTIENARFSARMIEDAGIKRVILVTDAWHMRRSVDRFRSAGLEVIPAPTNYATQPELSPIDFLPTTGGLFNSTRAFHEWIGILVSRARGV